MSVIATAVDLRPEHYASGGVKPEKPSPDFPLYAHSSGKWAKKIGGRTVYFGTWDDPAGALAKYEEATKRDTVSHSVLTLDRACNAFLAAKDRQKGSGELSARSFEEYRRTCARLLAFYGRERRVESLTPSDFAALRAKRSDSWNLVTLGNEVTRIKSMFKWLHQSRLIRDSVQFGPDFRKPSAKAARRHRRLQGKKLFTPDQIRLLIDEAGVHLAAMIHLGVNCGFGPADCATLPVAAVDLSAAWIRYPRPKTEVDRSCPLWPETVEALARSLRRRYEPTAETEGRFFVMRDGRPWDNSCNPICKHFRQCLERAGIERGGFYWLRHVCETTGGAAKDQVALNAIMGHVDGSMAAVYREEIEDSRLLAVANHTRHWLFG